MHPRYVHIQEVLRGLEELAVEGEIFRPAVPENYVIDYNDADHKYKIDGTPVPGVTSILDETEVKDALTWWGFRIGLAAVPELINTGRLGYAELLNMAWAPIVKPAEHEQAEQVSRFGKAHKLKSTLEWAVQEAKLDPYNVMKRKGTIGTSIHAAAEELQLTGEIPTISDFPAEDRGYVQALARYWIDQQPEIVAQEVIVGSQRFRYAGRFDNIVRTPDGQVRMRDYKTSGGVYSSFDKQLSLYDLAYREMGGDELDGHDIVHLAPNGDYTLHAACVDHADALVTLLKRLTDRDLKARLKGVGRAY